MAKNRKFNVAGSTIYTAKVSAGDIVHFVLEPNNPADKNAIRIINPNGETIGYVPKASAVEFQEFRTGKYPFYCAKVKEVWAGEISNVPKVLAHFTKAEEELPYQSQKWLVSV
jgi:hypothetical protein